MITSMALADKELIVPRCIVTFSPVKLNDIERQRVGIREQDRIQRVQFFIAPKT
jgi:hypothetical protein